MVICLVKLQFCRSLNLLSISINSDNRLVVERQAVSTMTSIGKVKL